MENGVNGNPSFQSCENLSCNDDRPPVQIRSPRPGDIQGIVDLVRDCEPFLSVHRSYIYWMNVQYFRETCAVAEVDGEIVGWCSAIRVSDAQYFLHQLGVAPKLRRQGIAAALFIHLLQGLRQRHAAFEVEFTSDRRNTAVLELNTRIAKRMGMRLTKKPDAVRVIEPFEEDLYGMRLDELERHIRPTYIATGASAGIAH